MSAVSLINQESVGLTSPNNIIDETSQTHQLIMLTGKRNNVVMISEENWTAIEETLYLNSVTGR